MTLKLTILGCGSSAGVPRIGGNWGACDPNNPKNRRRRCSLLVERQGAHGKTTVLVDTCPDLREQLLDADVAWLDGVLFTHDHADHTHGIDDLRAVYFNGRRKVDVYFDQATSLVLRKRFRYCFETPAGSGYPPILAPHEIRPLETVTIDGTGGGINAIPFSQIHGDAHSLGFRFGNIAYSCDVNGIADESLPVLENLDVWIVDALRYDYHPSHFNVEQSLEWIARIKPKRAVLTNLHVDLDFETLAKDLPDHIEPAYDGMVLETVSPQ